LLVCLQRNVWKYFNCTIRATEPKTTETTAIQITKPTNEEDKKGKKGFKLWLIVGITLLVVLIVSAGVIAFFFYHKFKSNRRRNESHESLEGVNDDQSSSHPKGIEKSVQTKMSECLKELVANESESLAVEGMVEEKNPSKKIIEEAPSVKIKPQTGGESEDDYTTIYSESNENDEKEVDASIEQLVARMEPRKKQ
jgi:hypothetical protein